jgi:simple sugar transport system permease protein
MSVPAAAVGPGVPGAPGAQHSSSPLARWAEATRRKRWYLVAVFAAAYLVVTILAKIADGPALTAEGTFNTMLILGAPILLAGLGGLYCERSGIVNIGLEGMMTLGTWGAAWCAWHYGAWWGVLGGVVGGLVGAAIMAMATVGFGVDHVVAGVALNILAPGITRYLSSKIFDGHGGSVSSSPQIKGSTGIFRCPFLAGGDLFGWQSPDLLGWIARQRWFYVSQVARALRGLVNGVPYTALLAFAMVPLSVFILWRTPFGLRLRSAGENPNAADSLGVPVYRMQVAAIGISGILAGFGGSLLVLESARVYREGQTGGRGFIGLAALIFGNYRPTGVGAGAALFGFADALGLRDLSGKSTRALLLLLAVVLALACAAFVRRRRVVGAVASLLIAAGVLLWFAVAARVPDALVTLVAPVVTLVVLTLGGRRLRPPASDGVVWRKGMRG